MSSESGEASSRPDTPRKRRRLRYRTTSHSRKHDTQRRPALEETYNDNYRLLYNEHVASAASRFEVDASLHYSKQVGASVWSSKEQATFFAALERLGKDDLPGIAAAIATKTVAEARDFILLLQDAAAKQGTAQVTLRDIPAAIELDRECCQRLEEAGDALAWYQEKLDAAQEEERYGKYWLITPQIAEEIEHAVTAPDRPRTASTPPASISEHPGRGTVGACIPCKKRRSKCDRGHPCDKCKWRNADCVYSDGKDVLNDTDRLRSSSNQHDSGPKRFGPGVAGACASCKKRKLKCDRRVPCTNCSRYGADCYYTKNPPGVAALNPVHTSMSDVLEGANTSLHEPHKVQILEAVPEGHLLRPEAMLTLSRELFMNRSSEFPSSWPHWSSYISGIATEPSMYRTALRDFHRLAISITQRLVQTAIVQAASRLRAQRLRSGGGVNKNKGHLPFVKERDVLAAIDVLGMKRNGSDRWRGVPRRCGLRVVVKEKTSKGRREKVVPWDEVERLLTLVASPGEQSPSGAESSTEPEYFDSRAARSGTPLPLKDLAFSDSDDGTAPGSIDGSNAILDDPPKDEQQPYISKHRPRDVAGKYTSVPPTTLGDEHAHQMYTVEDFDREASLHEQNTLWDLLGKEVASQPKVAQDDHGVPDWVDTFTGKPTTVPNDWREAVDFHAMWERYTKPVSNAKFLANRRSPDSMPTSRIRDSQRVGSSSSNASSAVLDERATVFQNNSTTEAELWARGTNAYAALQRNNIGRSMGSKLSTSSDAEDMDHRKDIPTQSVEVEHDTRELDTEEGMEWS